MKKFNTIFYLLFVLIIFGTFASMAQNSYGLSILGFVSIFFGFIFLYQLLKPLTRKAKKDGWWLLELGSLSLLSFLFAFRIFHIHFFFAEILFIFAGLALILPYLRKLIQRYLVVKSSDRKASIMILLFYLGLIAFIVALFAITFFPKISLIAGTIGFTLEIAYLLWNLLQGNRLIEGENISTFKWITRFQDSSALLFTLFLLISLYTGLTQTGILPGIYSDDFPQTYYRLVNEAETGSEKPVNGQYRHQSFKNAYDDFLDRNIKNRKGR